MQANGGDAMTTTVTRAEADDITEFDIALYAIEGACTLLWPKPWGHAQRLAAMERIQTAWDAMRAEEDPRPLPTLLTEGSAGV